MSIMILEVGCSSLYIDGAIAPQACAQLAGAAYGDAADVWSRLPRAAGPPIYGRLLFCVTY